MILYADIESYSETPIKNGTYRYAESAEVLLFAYAIDDGPVEVIDFTDDALLAYEVMQYFLEEADQIVFHNSMFDRTVIWHALGIDIPVERIHDTMVQAYLHALPGSLGTLSEVFGLAEDKAKSKRGKELIQLFCKPRPKNHKLRRATSETHPKEWQEFIDYARLDIEAMREIHRKMPTWNNSNRELSLWQLDQRINDRGFKVDLDLAGRAIEAVDIAKAALADATHAATHGEVSSATRRDALLRHIMEEYGVDLPDMQASTLERRMNDPELPSAVRDLLTIRLQASMSSQSKYKKLVEAVSADGRLRGTLQFSGAGRTRRWSGRTFQPQNLPRPTIKQKEIDLGIEAIKAGCADLITTNVMALCSSCVRGCIVPSTGKKLVVSDLSNIEGRVAAWLAREHWKLDAFAAYDAGTGDDLYRLAYAKAFNIPVDQVDGGADKGPHRQIGKVLELFMQYEGGAGAFITGSLTYGIDLDDLSEGSWDTLAGWAKSESQQAWQWAQKKHRDYGLSEKTYRTCDALKRMWRKAHPAISSYWKELKDAAVAAIEQPGREITARRVTLIRQGAWLRLTLPSGGVLCYAAPKNDRGRIVYKGINAYSRQWSTQGTYGGKIFENMCQSLARDVMADNMMDLEKYGYEPLLTVHDELITEAPAQYEHANSDELSYLLARNPPWMPDCPLAAGGYEAMRYRKD